MARQRTYTRQTTARSWRPSAAVALFLVSLLVGGLIVFLIEAQRAESRRRSVAEIAHGHAHLIEQRLNRSLGATFALAAAVRQGNGQVDGFNALARRLIREYGGISNLQLAPKAVVRRVFPLKGNEQALGHNLLKDPKRRTEALVVIRSRKLTLAGPYVLIQGGVGVIGRLPVFLPGNGRNRFWGFTIALIRLPLLLKTADLKQLEMAGYDYQLGRKNPDTGKRQVFTKSADKLSQPVTYWFNVPNGRWFLSVAPKGGRRPTAALPVEILFVLLISGLIGFTVNNLLTRADVLRREVAARNIADTLQRAVLSLPEKIAGIDFGHLYRSATEAAEVGGDFYDLFELEHDRVGVVIGDVSGKGLEAATLTSLIKDTLKAYSYEEASPAWVMARTNALVLKTTEPMVFASVFFGVLDTRTGALVYCNAGHPPPILKKGPETHLLDVLSPVIGVFPGLEFATGQVTLERDDMLILYTDGVIEARRERQLLGEERLVHLITDAGPISVLEMPQAIFDKVLDFAGGTLSDDVALLTLSLASF